MNEKRKKKGKGKEWGHPPGDISTKNDKFVKKNLQRVPVQRQRKNKKSVMRMIAVRRRRRTMVIAVIVIVRYHGMVPTGTRW